MRSFLLSFWLLFSYSRCDGGPCAAGWRRRSCSTRTPSPCFQPTSCTATARWSGLRCPCPHPLLPDPNFRWQWPPRRVATHARRRCAVRPSALAAYLNSALCPCPHCGWALQQKKRPEAIADAEVLPPPPHPHHLWIGSADSLALTTVAAPVPCAQECIKLDPTFAKGYYRKGTALQDLKKYGPAYDAYKLARASRPQLSANHRAPLADFRKGGGPTLTSPAVCCSGKDQEGQRIRAWAATACRALAADLSLTECPLPYPMPLPRIN